MEHELNMEHELAGRRNIPGLNKYATKTWRSTRAIEKILWTFYF